MSKNTAIINIKVEPETKRQAQLLADELGFSLSSVINSYLKQFVKTRTLTVSAHEIPNAETIKAYQNSEEELKARNYQPQFENFDEALSYFREVASR